MAEKTQRPVIQRATIQRPQKAVIQRPQRVPRGMMAPDFDTLFEPDDPAMLDGLPDLGDIEANADREVDIALDELLAQRRQQKERWRTTNDDEFWFAVCFQSRAQKEEFLARLEAAVEGKTAELIAEATGLPVTPAVRVLAPDEAAKAAKLAATA